jgi:hypothetical protein
MMYSQIRTRMSVIPSNNHWKCSSAERLNLGLGRILESKRVIFLPPCPCPSRHLVGSPAAVNISGNIKLAGGPVWQLPFTDIGPKCQHRPGVLGISYIYIRHRWGNVQITFQLPHILTIQLQCCTIHKLNTIPTATSLNLGIFTRQHTRKDLARAHKRGKRCHWRTLTCNNVYGYYGIIDNP